MDPHTCIKRTNSERNGNLLTTNNNFGAHEQVKSLRFPTPQKRGAGGCSRQELRAESYLAVEPEITAKKSQRIKTNFCMENIKNLPFKFDELLDFLGAFAYQSDDFPNCAGACTDGFHRIVQ